MLNPIFVQIPRTVIEVGGSSKISELVKDLKPSKILITTDKGIINAGLTKSIESSLRAAGYQFDVFDGCQTNAPSSIVQQIIRLIREEKYDLLISVGGGSTIDTTKAAAVMAPSNMTLIDLINGKDEENAVPLVIVPTTSGTGSEWDDGAVITDESDHMKKWIIHKRMWAKAVLLDAELTINLPAKITAETGFDVLSHAIEGLITLNPNVLSDMFAETAIKLVANNLRKVYVGGKENIEARHKMQIAASLAIKACTVAGNSISHLMDPEIVIKTHISHGAACGILLPHNMQFEMQSVAPQRYAKIAELMGEKVAGLSMKEAGLRAIEAVKKLRKDLKLPQTMSEVGVKEADISRFVDDCWKFRSFGFSLMSARPITKEDLVQVYKKAL